MNRCKDSMLGLGGIQLEKDHGFEAGSYLRLTDFVYHSPLGLRVIKKKKKVYRYEQCTRVD